MPSSKKKSKKKKKLSTNASSPSPSPPQNNLSLTTPETLTESSESTATAATTTNSSASNSFASSSCSSSSTWAGESSSSAAAGDDGDGDERRDLAWLIDAFGAASIGLIESAYRLAGGDAYLAAGILGSDPQPPDPPPDTPPSPSPSPPPPPPPPPARRACRKQKRVAVVASGMVADVIGREYSRAVPIGGNKERDCDVEWYRAAEAKVETKYNGEEAEQFLCSMLGNSSELGMGVIKDVLGEMD